MIGEICICGHDKKAHADRYFGTNEIPKSDCFFIVAANGTFCKCMIFKLDNLKLVEDLAKERNLV